MQYEPYPLNNSLLHYVGDDWRDEWGRLSAWVEARLDKLPTFSNTMDLYRALDGLENRLWKVTASSGKTNAYITTRVTESSYGRIGYIDLAVGRNLDDWIDVVDFMKKYFKALDCRAMRVEGRRGWLKKLAEYGMAEHSVTLMTEL